MTDISGLPPDHQPGLTQPVSSGSGDIAIPQTTPIVIQRAGTAAAPVSPSSDPGPVTISSSLSSGKNDAAPILSADVVAAQVAEAAAALVVETPSEDEKTPPLADVTPTIPVMSVTSGAGKDLPDLAASPSSATPPSSSAVPFVSPGAPNGPTPPANSFVALLVTQGKLTLEQYQQLVIEQASSGKSIEALIEEQHIVKETELTKAKAEFYTIPFIGLSETGASPEAISLIPESVARRYQMLPFALDKQNNQLSVAMKNPLDLSAIDFVEKKTSYHIVPYFSTPTEIDRMIAERYAQSLSSEVNAALKETAQDRASSQQVNPTSVFSREVVREAPITKIVETVLGFAVKSRASDVHIEPQEDRTRVRYRIDGILTEKLILPRTVHEAVISRIKILSDMKIDEKRIPQDGRFSFMSEGQEVDLRVSSLPTTFGEKIVMRLLKKNATVPTLGDLGLRDLALKNVEEAIKIPHGIVLVTGPTGSGKTTTLYSILHNINTPKVNIVTLEDPVEYQMMGVNQVQVNTPVGLTFASGLRSFLRQDPNIIMVGEIRDTETAALAVQASLTGHLVFSTLHTNSAAGALPRLIDMEVEPFLLSSSLTLVIGQRVARKINTAYKEEYTPAPEVAEDVKRVLGPLYKQWCTQHDKDPDKLVLYRTTANRPEDEPEYSGRVAIFEVLRMTEEVSRMVIEQKSSKEIEDVAVEKNGMLLMKQDGYMKALDGVTTIEEVLRVAEV